MLAGLGLRLLGIGWGMPGRTAPDQPPIHPDEHVVWQAAETLYATPPPVAFVYGGALSVAGLVYLFATVPYAAGVAAAATLVSYVLIYTPLKTVTVWNTVVGAVPGALPPVIGWCAARGWEGMPAAFGLFLVIFLWQLPHFLAIAWMYRDDYARGGLRMLPITDPSGSRTAWVMVVICSALIPVGLLAVGLQVAGPFAARAAVNTEVTVPAIVDMIAELNSIRSEAPTADELDAARDYLVGVFPLRFETPGAVVGALTGLVMQGLPDDELARYRRAIETVDANAVLAAAKAHVRPAEAAIVLVGDADAFMSALEAADLGPITVERDEA